MLFTGHHWELRGCFIGWGGGSTTAVLAIDSTAIEQQPDLARADDSFIRLGEGRRAGCWRVRRCE